MSNWHNEVFDDLGWFADYIFGNKAPKPVKHGPGAYCPHCGTVTGQHGFSFNSEGRYD